MACVAAEMIIEVIVGVIAVMIQVRLGMIAGHL
jgi:hypothetical protein